MHSFILSTATRCMQALNCDGTAVQLQVLIQLATQPHNPAQWTSRHTAATDNKFGHVCYLHNTGTALEVGLNELPVLPFHLDAGQVVQPLLVLEDLHCRRAIDAARLCDLRVLLDVDLHQVQLRQHHRTKI